MKNTLIVVLALFSTLMYYLMAQVYDEMIDTKEELQNMTVRSAKFEVKVEKLSKNQFYDHVERCDERIRKSRDSICTKYLEGYILK